MSAAAKRAVEAQVAGDAALRQQLWERQLERLKPAEVSETGTALAGRAVDLLNGLLREDAGAMTQLVLNRFDCSSSLVGKVTTFRGPMNHLQTGSLAILSQVLKKLTGRELVAKHQLRPGSSQEAAIYQLEKFELMALDKPQVLTPG